MASVRKSEAALAKYERVGLTQDGKNWIISAVDPFHDLPIMPTGDPDHVTDESIPVVLRQQITLDGRDTENPDDNWDCSIWLDQLLNDYVGARGQFLANGNCLHPDDTRGSLPHLGGVNAVIVNSGQTTDLSSQSLPNTLAVRHVPLPANYLTGALRVTAIGFEVYNTTSDLQKQGSVTVWRLPNIYGQKSVPFIYKGQYLIGEVMPKPPGNVSDATELTTSKQWAAKEGCYVVAARDGPCDVNRMVPRMVVRSDSYSDALLSGSTAGTSTGDWFSNGVVNKAWTENAVNYTVNCGTPSLSHAFSMCGAYFTGLSPQTTLTLRVNFFLERFPTEATPELIPLARPRPTFDPIALEIYSRIISEMPAGVPVKDNGLGTWFAEAVSNVAPYVSGALSAIPHPIAQGAAMAAKTAGKLADSFLVQASPAEDATLRKQKAKKKRKKAKAQAQAALQGGKRKQ